MLLDQCFQLLNEEPFSGGLCAQGILLSAYNGFLRSADETRTRARLFECPMDSFSSDADSN